MYCPRCNTQNKSEEKYCRQCGLPLGSVRLALGGRAEEAASRYKKGSGSLSAGAIILAVCSLVALLNLFLGSEPRNYGVLINLLVGLLVASPMIVAGLVRVSRAERLLKDKGSALSLAGEQTDGPAPLPAAGHRDDLPGESLSPPHSIAERTTLKLERGAERG